MVMFSPSSPQPETPIPLLPRLVAWARALRPGLLFVLALWALFVLWTAIGLFSSIGTVMHGLSASPDDYYLTYRSPAELALNFWALDAAIGLAFIVANPFRWGNGKRLALGCTAFAIKAC